MTAGFVPPPYPYDRLREVIDLARDRFGEPIDLSIGTPCDPPPDAKDGSTRVDIGKARRYYPPILS